MAAAFQAVSPGSRDSEWNPGGPRVGSMSLKDPARAPRLIGGRRMACCPADYRKDPK